MYKIKTKSSEREVKYMKNKVNVKKIAKWAGASCCAVGIVALSGLIASGAAVGAVVEGFKAAKETIGAVLKKEELATDEIVLKEVTEDI